MSPVSSRYAAVSGEFEAERGRGVVHAWSGRQPPRAEAVATIDRRPTRNGGVRWRARVRRLGFSETASFGSLTEAEQWAGEVERAIERGQWSGKSPAAEMSCSQLLDRYLVLCRPSKDTRRQLEWWRGLIGGETLAHLSQRTILQLRNRLASEVTRRGRRRAPATVNRYMAALSGFLSWALRRGHLDFHPVRGIEPLRESPGRVRCLSETERRRLLAVCRQTGGLRLQALVVLALASGARRGELLGLRWSDFDLAQRRVTFRGKGRLRTRTLPLSDPAIKLVRELSRVRHINSDEIFADANGRVVFPRSAWRSVLDSAGIEDFRFQDLRHSTAAYLAQSGASLPEIAEVLGHRTLQAVRRYSPLVGPRAPAAVGRMHDQLFGD